MEKIFHGKIWKFGSDIDTDTIIPGKRATIPDNEEMKKYTIRGKLFALIGKNLNNRLAVYKW